MPKQWRHLVIIGFAALAAVIGFDQQNPAPNVNASQDSTPVGRVAGATDTRFNVQLPSVSSVKLPPIPTLKETSKRQNFAATHYVLIDDESKLSLADRGADERIAIASTTKIITAMVALENYRLDDVVTISPRAIATIGSAVGFRPGETATVEELIHGLLIVSGNDAANALAEIMAQPGDTDPTERFVAKMNAMVTRLGLDDTRLYDPAGLNDQGYSTPREMATFMSYALKDDTFRKISGLGYYEYTSPQNYRHTFTNSNRLVVEQTKYAGVIGGKTGYTPKTAEGGAGHCLIVAAQRDGHTLIAAVYNTHAQTPQASSEVSRSLFDYGYANYTWQTINR